MNRWQQAYDDIKASIAVLEKCGNGLQNFEAPGNNAAGWAKLFSEVEGNKEAVMITLYNTTASTRPRIIARTILGNVVFVRKIL